MDVGKMTGDAVKVTKGKGDAVGLDNVLGARDGAFDDEFAIDEGDL